MWGPKAKGLGMDGEGGLKPDGKTTYIKMHRNY